MKAENLYAHGLGATTLLQRFADLNEARTLYPYLNYIAQGPARAGSLPDLIRAVHEDPRAFDLAAALEKLQPRRNLR